MGDGSTTALPVALHLGGRHAEAIRGWVEGVLGWQPVDADTARLVPAALVVLDGAAAGRGEPPGGGVPTILLVDDGLPAGEVAATVVRLRPDAVVVWPSGRDGLVEAAAAALDQPRHPSGSVRVLRVGGSAGGVGVTTVALALGGLSAWDGTPTLVGIRSTGIGVRGLPMAALAGPDVWSRAEPVPGVSQQRMVGLLDQTPVPEPSDPAVGALIVDQGVDPDVEVLVCRPDEAALTVLKSTTAAAVVVVGDGPARPKDLRTAAAGRRMVHLPWSGRVARAGLIGRVPAGFPGAWLRRLRPVWPPAVAPGGVDGHAGRPAERP